MSERRFLPWSDGCFVCGEKNPAGLGLRFEVDGEGTVVVDPLVIPPVFEGYPGHVHGGVITAVLDESAGWACTVASGRLLFTVEITVRFRKPVPGGTPLVLEARCLESGRRISRGRSEIRDRDGTVLAEAEGRFVRVPESEQRATVPELKMPGRRATPEDLRGGLRRDRG